MTDLNPHHQQMADESMVRTLDAQARATWPQETPLLLRFALPPEPRVLDAGCGTGEGASRLAELFPGSRVLGVDILDHHLALARRRHAGLGARLAFEHQSIYELAARAGTYDLTVCRHVIHSIPDAPRVLAELLRVTKPGGWLHLIPEDYGMLHFPVHDLDVRAFWHETPQRFGAATGTDLFVGRHAYGHLRDLGLLDITVDYLVVDTARVPRETFAEIITAWRDEYVQAIGEVTRFSANEARAHFNQMIADIHDPRRYAAWLVPVVAGRVPGSFR